MRRVVLVILMGAVALWATPAGAAASCEQAFEAFVAEHPKVHRQAGAPTVECHADLPPGRAGEYVYAFNVVQISDATPEYGYVIAHELGHAWRSHRPPTGGPGSARTYAFIRGFPTDPATIYSEAVIEDFSETFAFALGDWVPVDAAAPYQFKNVAGTPTLEQLRRLIDARLLPQENAVTFA